jgi:hypothetical protein
MWVGESHGIEAGSNFVSFRYRLEKVEMVSFSKQWPMNSITHNVVLDKPAQQDMQARPKRARRIQQMLWQVLPGPVQPSQTL